jgi:hypothetical protein
VQSHSATSCIDRSCVRAGLVYREVPQIFARFLMAIVFPAVVVRRLQA